MSKRHLAWPVRKDKTAVLATVQERSAEDLAMQTGLIAVTKRGERPLVPGFGVDSPVGAKRVDPEVLRAACDEWISPGVATVSVLQLAGGIVEETVEVHP